MSKSFGFCEERKPESSREKMKSGEKFQVMEQCMKRAFLKELM